MSDCKNKAACNNGDGSCNCGNECCNVSKKLMVRGIVALCFGLFFIGLAYRIIIWVICFGVGISLIYYGLRVLGITQVTEAIDSIAARIKKIFESI